MEEALIITTAIAVLLFVGVICSWIGNKLKIPDVLLLILTGMFFGQATFQGEKLVQFPEVFLSSLAILALAMIVFDSTARLRLKELDAFSLKTIRFMFLFTILTLILFTAATYHIAQVPFWSSLLLAAIMIGTSPEVALSFQGKSKTLTLLKLESIFNTPLTVILPFLILDLMQNVKTNILTDLFEQAVPFVMNLIVGIGTGVFVGLILFKLVQHVYKEIYSPLAVIIATLLSYVLAENLGGSGVLAVTALGLFFGNAYIKEKPTLLGIESVLTKALYILVFILTGIIIKIPLTKKFIITSIALFIIYTIIRFFATWLSFRDEKYNTTDLIIIALTAPKGIATAAVLFILVVYNITGLTTIIDLTFAFILYSIIVSTITNWIYIFHQKRSHKK
ncbi:hypothetical protein COV18_00095 [Candidatus Woesearchaeota archaeon CG10_big_fil_rev_8_21_14_0_10_37_12]|nr:MAG: hypothetical protein COV18_00095 [Candidatus Woesearchaeota archaeon CG10_big_fil_rev_8_21_14_0_10_37_12]